MLKFLFLFVFVFSMISHAMAVPVGSLNDLTFSIAPSKQIVWNWSADRCDPRDTLDAPAHGFRDRAGNLHVFASEPIAHPLLGKTLTSLQPSCLTAFVSSNDPDPSHFSDQNWLSGFYSEDGVHVYAVAHTEYHGWLFWGKGAPGCSNNPLCEKLPPECDAPNHSKARPNAACWYNAVTAAFSTDGGDKFFTTPAPSNYIAGIPLQYNRAIWRKPSGFWSPTNIIRYGDNFYIMANVWTIAEGGFRQNGGTCLIRTTTLNPGSIWYAWDGEGFAAKMTDPYSSNFMLDQQRPCYPLKHVYAPSSLNPVGKGFVILEYATDNRFGGAPGLYSSFSTDLLHWAKPRLVISEEELLLLDDPSPSVRGKKCPWKYGFFSLMDDSPSGFSLDSIGTRASLFYIRFDTSNPPYSRALLRRNVQISF